MGDIEMLKDEEAAAVNGEKKKIENELDREERLDELSWDLEDEVAGFVEGV